MANDNATVRHITMELDISASPAEVWAALTDGIDQWWPAEFYAGGEDGERSFALEAWPGGRMLESWTDTGGVLWGTVIGIEPQVKLQVVGHLFPGWGGPAQWYGTWTLQPKKNQTTLTFSESSVGQLAGSDADAIKGWTFLWHTLRAHVEKKPAPAWPD